MILLLFGLFLGVTVVAFVIAAIVTVVVIVREFLGEDSE